MLLSNGQSMPQPAEPAQYPRLVARRWRTHDAAYRRDLEPKWLDQATADLMRGELVELWCGERGCVVAGPYRNKPMAAMRRLLDDWKILRARAAGKLKIFDEIWKK